MMHLLRKKLRDDCPVCAARAFDACIPATDAMRPVQLEFDVDNDLIEVGALEFEILSAVRRLRELRPHHTLVTVLEAVLRYQAKDQPLRG